LQYGECGISQAWVSQEYRVEVKAMFTWLLGKLGETILVFGGGFVAMLFIGLMFIPSAPSANKRSDEK